MRIRDSRGRVRRLNLADKAAGVPRRRLICQVAKNPSLRFLGASIVETDPKTMTPGPSRLLEGVKSLHLRLA